MDKVVLFKEVRIPFPLIGIPIVNHFNTYVSALTNSKCVIRTRLSLRRRCNDENGDTIHELDDLRKYILNRFNTVLGNIGKECIEGDLDVQCDNDLPLILVLPVLECEISRKLLMIGGASYTHILNIFSNLDTEMLNVDPGYLRSLRCSYLFKAMCISRGYEDIVHNVDLALSIENVNRYKCDSKTCTYISNPYDNYLLSLLYKLTTHTISQFIHSLVNNGTVEPWLRNMIRLVYIIESEIIRNSLGIKMNYPIDEANLYKVIADLNQVVIYRITLS
ncbi:MAG: hypothetical protein QXF17_06430 [Ignisphaera sp.]